MLIVLPPSQGKSAARRGNPVDLDGLSFPELTATRRRVADALLTTDSGLLTAPSRPAGRLYSGVLYAALGLDTLDPASKRRAHSRLVILSALWGAVRVTDRLPGYRLTMGDHLPGLGPLAGVWRHHLGPVLSGLAGHGLIVDCRSGPYVSAWRPRGDQARRWVQVTVVQQRDGRRAVVSHHAKHTRGRIARTLVQSAAKPTSPQGLVEMLSDYRVELTPPSTDGRPWTLVVVTP